MVGGNELIVFTAPLIVADGNDVFTPSGGRESVIIGGFTAGGVAGNGDAADNDEEDKEADEDDEDDVSGSETAGETSVVEDCTPADIDIIGAVEADIIGGEGRVSPAEPDGAETTVVAATVDAATNATGRVALSVAVLVAPIIEEEVVVVVAGEDDDTCADTAAKSTAATVATGEVDAVTPTENPAALNSGTPEVIGVFVPFVCCCALVCCII